MKIPKELKAITQMIVATTDIEKIFLFGSYAYGKPTKQSDYDLYVIISDFAGNPVNAIQDMYVKLSKAPMKTPVDILALPLSRFNERAKLTTLEKQVNSKGIVLYEKFDR